MHVPVYSSTLTQFSVFAASFYALVLAEYFPQCNLLATITGSLCPRMTAAAAVAVFLSSNAPTPARPCHAASPHVLTAYVE